MTKQSLCELFHDDLTAVLDGEPGVVDRHLDHLADCDDCRDLRHEAGGYAAAVASAGADYRDPSDMLARVLGHINEQDGGEQKPLQAARAQAAPATVASIGQQPATQRHSRTRSRRWVPAAIGATALAAAATITAYVAIDGNSAGDASSGEHLTANVSEINQSGGDNGLTFKLANGEFVPAASGEVIAAGAVIRTDNRTRARLALSDGSEITLNQATEVELDAKAPRGLRLRSGELVAEIAKLKDGPNAVFSTANAKVEVLGTRFLLAASGDYTSVRVSRGLVSLSTGVGSDEVRPGEEGIARGNVAPEVFAAGQLAEAMSFAEISTDDLPADGAMAGIGELRAFKPGEKRDRDWKLKVAKQKVTVRIAGNIARTEIEQVFQNDSKTTLEGVYKFPLPSDAKIDRLALDVDKGFEEGAFVDKARAAKIWRGVIQKATNRRKKPKGNDLIWVPGPWRDPALLEWQRGGRFELRIFPIPKKGSRTIKLAYTQVLPPQGSSRRYVYPLAYAKDGSTTVDDFSLDVRIDGADPMTEPRVLGYQAPASFDGEVASMAYGSKDFKPRGNFIVEYAPIEASAELRAWTFRGDVAAAPGANSNSKRGGLDPKVAEAQAKIAADKRPTALFAITPKLPRWSQAHARDFVFVVDASHSMQGERSARMRRLLAAAVGEMDRRDRISVLACDVECREMSGEALTPSAKVGGDVDAWLAKISPAGASNLSGAIETGAALAANRKRQDADAWVVLLSDGASSMGFRSAAGLERTADASAAKHNVSISAVGIGSDADDTVLGAIARAGGGHFLPWKPGQATSAAALALLETTYGVSLENPSVTLPSQMDDVAPARLATIRAGQEILVAARFDGQVAGDVVLRGTVGGKSFEQRYPIQLAASDARGNAFVPRMWASLEIARRELEANQAERHEIVALSKAYGVLSRHTSLLVLESDAMFKAFGIDRSQPNVRWTGDEGSAESSTAGGLVAFGNSLAAGRASSRVDDPLMGLDFGGDGESAEFDDDEDMGAGRGGAREKEQKDKSKNERPKKKPRRKSDGKLANKTSAPAPVTPSKPRDVASTEISRPMPRSRRPGQWMRKVWYRTGSVAKFDTVGSRAIKAVADAESAHRADPNSREAHRKLVQRLSAAGQIDRATEVATKWLERDRFDAEALIYLADMLSRSGDRAAGLRLLSGIVDVAPDNASFHERLASAYENADKTNAACAHRVSAAEIRGDSTRVSRVVRCLRGSGHSADATWILARTTEKVRAEAEKKAARDLKTKSLRGQLQIEASWLGSVDLDISIVTKDGVRISWMGGDARVSGADAMTPGREKLAMRRIRSGRYTIEISRSDATDMTPIDGSLEITLLKKKKTLPFKLGPSEKRSAVGSLRVRSRSRMVPM